MNNNSHKFELFSKNYIFKIELKNLFVNLSLVSLFKSNIFIVSSNSKNISFSISPFFISETYF